MSPILAGNRFLGATVTNFFFFLSLNGFILLPLHIQALGGTEVEIGLVMGIYNAAGIVGQPLLGPWVDAVGRRPFMILGVALLLASTLIATLASSIAVLAFVRALQGVAFSAFFVSTFSYVIDLVEPARRGWALGIFGVSGLLATSFAPLGSEWIIRRFGYRPLFALAALCAALTLLLVVQLREGPRAEPPASRQAFWEADTLDEVFRRHMAVTAFFGLGSGTIFVFLPTFAEKLGVRTLALFYTAFAVAAMAARVFGGRLIDTLGRRAVIVPSMFGQAAATAMLAALGLLVTATSPVPVLPVLFLAGFVAGASHGFLYPGLAALVADRTPDTRRGAAVGLFSAVFLVGQTAGAFAFGSVAHAFGYGVMWSILTTLLVLGGVLSVRLNDNAPRGQGL